MIDHNSHTFNGEKSEQFNIRKNKRSVGPLTAGDTKRGRENTDKNNISEQDLEPVFIGMRRTRKHQSTLNGSNTTTAGSITHHRHKLSSKASTRSAAMN